MKTSCIRHPEDESLIILRLWQREACEGNNCAGFLLSYFEYWHNVKLRQSHKARQANDVAEMHGDPRAQDEGLNQWHNEEELEEGLLWEYGRKTIREALVLLEGKGFIARIPNPNPKYRFDKTAHFVFRPGAVNAWLALHRPTLDEADFGRPGYDREPSKSDEVKLPQRRGKKSGTSGKNTSSSGKNTSSYTENTSGDYIQSGGEERAGASSAPGDTALAVVVETVTDIELLERAEQLPEYMQPPKSVDPELWVALLKVCKLPLFCKLTKQQAVGLNDVASVLTRGERTAAHVYAFERRWYESWHGKDGMAPTPRQIRELWGQLMTKREVANNDGGKQSPGLAGISKLAERQQQRREGNSNGH